MFKDGESPFFRMIYNNSFNLLSNFNVNVLVLSFCSIASRLVYNFLSFQIKVVARCFKCVYNSSYSLYTLYKLYEELY